MRVNKSLISNYELYLLDDKYKLNLLFVDISKQDAMIQLVTYAINNILHYTPEEAVTLLSDDILSMLKLKKNVDNFISYPAGLTQEEKIKYLVSLCFPDTIHFNFKKYAINIYKDVSEGNGSYPNMFFSNDFKELVSSICLTYAISRDLIPQKTKNIEELYEFFADTKKAMAYLKSVKLDMPAKKIYLGSTLDFLHFSLDPRNQSWFLYEYQDYAKNIQDMPDIDNEADDDFDEDIDYE